MRDPRAMWKSWTRRQQTHAAVLLAITAAAVVHQVIFWFWFIEDAAISFAYAKHLAAGEGLVAFPGGERVEGYSNPLWVALLAVGYLVGIDGFVSSKVLQVLFCIFTVPLTYLVAREADPDGDSPLFAAGALAASAQFALWGSSGLENALFNLLMAAGLWRVLVESRTGRWPWSALIFFGLAITRPEAILYAAVAGLFAMIFGLRRSLAGGALQTIKWLLTFFVPFGGYHAARYAYFAWEWPNTYYAKLDHRTSRPWLWSGRGWKYVRNWAHEVGYGYFLPVFLISGASARSWRFFVALACLLAVGVPIVVVERPVLIVPLLVGVTWCMVYGAASRAARGRPAPIVALATLLLFVAFAGFVQAMRMGGYLADPVSPEGWQDLPTYSVAAVALLLPLLTLDSAGWKVRALCWYMSVLSVFFAVWAIGDWMKGWRWLSLLAVPVSVLFGLGINDLATAARGIFGRHRSGPPRWGVVGWGIALVLLVALIPGNVRNTKKISDKRDTTPYSVKNRVEYTQGVAQRLHIEGQVVNLDVDQGAHLYWSDYHMLDIAGLIDVPMAQHKFEKKFIQEYIFEENKPHFAHVHGGWASNSKIPTHREWKSGYFEIPGYPAGARSYHIGNYIRKDIMMVPHFPHVRHRRVIDFDDGVKLEGLWVPSKEAARSRRFYVEIGVSSRKRRSKENFRALLFLSDDDGRLATFDLPMGYDWLMPDKWGRDEVFHGKYSLLLPGYLEQGTYDLGIVFLDSEGAVLAVQGEQALPDDAVVGTPESARFAAGEVLFPERVQVVDLDSLSVAAKEDREEAEQHADKDRCEEAELSWWLARMHRPRGQLWVEQHESRVHAKLAACWARRAQGSSHVPVQVALLEKARGYDRWSRTVVEVAGPVADTLEERGMAAYWADDWEGAYAALADALRVEPQRAWARRYAELARARKLGIDDESKARELSERQERLNRRKERDETRNPKEPPAKLPVAAPRKAPALEEK